MNDEVVVLMINIKDLRKSLSSLKEKIEHRIEKAEFYLKEMEKAKEKAG